MWAWNSSHWREEAGTPVRPARRWPALRARVRRASRRLWRLRWQLPATTLKNLIWNSTNKPHLTAHVRKNSWKISSSYHKKRLYYNVCILMYSQRALDQPLMLIFSLGYSCALVSDILLQGHLYITENYFAFHSNVFGYVTRVSIQITNNKASLSLFKLYPILSLLVWNLMR